LVCENRKSVSFSKVLILALVVALGLLTFFAGFRVSNFTTGVFIYAFGTAIGLLGVVMSVAFAKGYISEERETRFLRLYCAGVTLFLGFASFAVTIMCLVIIGLALFGDML